MSQPSHPILRALTWLFLLVFGAIVGEYFVRWADELGVYSAPHLPVTQVTDWIGWAIDAFYLRYVATFLAGLLLGWRIGVANHRQQRAAARASAVQITRTGQRAIILAAQIDKHLQTPLYLRRGDDANLLGEISSLFFRLDRLGLEFPGVDEDLDSSEKLARAATFLKAIGPLLRDRHLEEAKYFAEKLCQETPTEA